MQHHGHVATVLAGIALDDREVGDVVGDPAQDLHAELGVGHLPTTEHDRELHLVALAEEPHHVLHLRRVVVLVDLGPELHLLDDDVRGLALRLPAPLLLLVDVPAVVHDPTDRRVGVGRDLDQVELLFAGLGQRLGQGADPQLLAVGADEEDLAGSDAVVDPDLVCSYVVTCFIGELPPGGRKPGPGRDDGGHGNVRHQTTTRHPAMQEGSHNMRTRRTRSVAWCWWPGGDPSVDPTSL